MQVTNYATLTRQSGLLREMHIVANNLANMATTGFRQEGIVFSEYVKQIGSGGSVSMAHANTRATSFGQGALDKTGAALDVAIEGDGFFLVQTPGGERLTRSGNFTTDATGTIVNSDGHPVLDSGFTPIVLPRDGSGVAIASDGTLSSDGNPVGQIGTFLPVEPAGLVREDGVLFSSAEGVEPAQDARLVQGFLEASNVNPVLQLSRMIEIQRAYEMGQSFLDSEEERLRTAMKTFIR